MTQTQLIDLIVNEEVLKVLKQADNQTEIAELIASQLKEEFNEQSN